MVEVALFSIPERHPDTHCHDSHWRNQQHHHALANCLLPFLGTSRGSRVAHSASLAKDRGGPQAQECYEHGGAQFHFGPNAMMRRASGKKIIIKAKHSTRAHIVIHFICVISYFMCMK